MDKLNSLAKYGINLGLERIEKLLNNMGNPQKKLKYIHIAGTNGKGSTCTILSYILKESGYKTGLFISPYILNFNETMQINNLPIPHNQLESCGEYVFSCWENSCVKGEYPTQFEVITAIAFEWFYRSGCNFVCLECGLGGKEDSTNIIPPALLQIITSVSLDHMGILGNTLEQITMHKAGIIKGGITICYPLMHPDALNIIKHKCDEAHSRLIVPSLQHLTVMEDTFLENSFIYKEQQYIKSMTGRFQIYNCITAITAAFTLAEMGFSIQQRAITEGVKNAKIPARQEIIRTSPLVLLDGCHNPEGAKALQDSLYKLPSQRLTVIMGVLADKDYNVMVKEIASLAHHFIAVTPDNPRALASQSLALTAKAYCSNVYNFDEMRQALDFATEITMQSDSICVCGSLYLAQQIRPLLLQQFKNGVQ
nr:folylpolyglutamate synthase/dihydrofolate synthase family protein [uncultured Clostridium sp.]